MGAESGDTLRESGVDLDERSWSIAHTATASAHLRADGSATYEFDIDWSLPHVPSLGNASLVHIGSLGAFLEPGATRVRQLVADLPPGITVTFDPNIRPQLLSDREAIQDRMREIAGRADVIKLSDEDATWLYPGLETDGILDLLIRAGARVVALTCGGQGADIASREARIHVDAPAVDVVDTVGAGDSFMAALAHDLLEGSAARSVEIGEFNAGMLHELGARAARAAAVTVARAGADLPTQDEIAPSSTAIHRRTFLGAIAVLAGAASLWRSDGGAVAASVTEVSEALTPPGHAGIVGVL